MMIHIQIKNEQRIVKLIMNEETRQMAYRFQKRSQRSTNVCGIKEYGNQFANGRETGFFQGREGSQLNLHKTEFISMSADRIVLYYYQLSIIHRVVK